MVRISRLIFVASQFVSFYMPRLSLPSILTLIYGTAGAQLLAILALPILGRMYAPADFALNGVCIALVLTGAYAVNGGYDMALMLPKTHSDALALARRGTWLSDRIVAGVLLLALALWPLLPWQHITVSELQGWHLCIPVALWLEGRIQPLNMLLNRFMDYRTLARMRMIRALCTAWLPVALGLWQPHHIMLMAGYMLGQVLALAVGYRRLRAHTEGITPSDAAASHQAYGDFPRYGVISNWLNMTAKQLPMLLLPSLAGVSAAGLFERCQKVLMLPVGTLAMPVGEVYYREGSVAETGLRGLTIRTMLQLLAVVALPAWALVTFGPQLFYWVLGPEWLVAGEYARWLAPWMVLLFVTAPLAYVVDIQRELKAYTYLNLANFVIQAAGLLLWEVVYPTGSPVQVYAVLATAGLVAQLVFFVWIAGKPRPAHPETAVRK